MTEKKVPMNEIQIEVIDRDLWAQVEVRIGEGKGSRWIRFSPKQARRTAVKLLNLADEAESVRAAKEEK